MRWAETLKDESVKRVIQLRNYSPAASESLGKAVADFVSFLNVSSPSEAVERLRSLSDEALVETFREYFISRKGRLSPKTLWNWSNAVKVWLYENRIRADRISRDITREYRRYVAKRGIPKLLKRDIMEKEEIRRLILAGDVRERALIAVLASSGLRIGVSGLKLQLKHFRDKLEDDLPCYMLEIPEELTKAEAGEEEPHVTFISREARDYLLAYLQTRKKSGEQITPESYLFISHHSNGNSKINRERPQPLSYNGALHMFRRLCEVAQIDRRPVAIPGRNGLNSQVRYNIRFHSLRKYFKTACSVSGVDRVASEAMLGHSLKQLGIESVYDYCIQNLQWLREQYMRALPALTFVAEQRSVVDEKVTLSRIEKLEKIINDLTNEVAIAKASMLIYLKALERLAKTAGLSREEVSSLLREAGGGITAEDIKKVSKLTEAIRRLAKELEERQE